MPRFAGPGGAGWGCVYAPLRVAGPRVTVLGEDPTIGLEKPFFLLALLPAQARTHTAPRRVFDMSSKARNAREGAWLV